MTATTALSVLSDRRRSRARNFDRGNFRNNDGDGNDGGMDEEEDYNHWNDDDEPLYGPSKQRKSSNPFISSTRSSSTPSPTTTSSDQNIVTSNNNVASSHFFSRKSLQDFVADSDSQLSSQLFLDLCRGAGIDRPSRIQSLAWPILKQGKVAIVADQTGSGKTLAYLIPLLQRALSSSFVTNPDDKNNNSTRRIKAPYGTPKILVLSPTAELADQTHTVCNKLARVVNFNTLVLTANGGLATSIRDQIRLLQRTSFDVLISTPGRLSTILRTRKAGLDLSQLTAIVLDEVDVLLVDETFGPQLRTVGAAAPIDQTQFVFCTATLPNHVVETVKKEFPNVVQIRGPGLHRVAPTVQERLVDVSVPPSLNRDPNACFSIKAEQLLKALRDNKCRRTLVFCNTIETCRKVENLLSRRDRRGKVLEVIPYHNALTPEVRNENLRRFSHGQSNQDDKSNKVDYVLVCTDRAARGIDFDAAPVDHVVIFDFPKDPADYVRRVGRTARAGRTGTSTVFAFGWQLPTARTVMGKTVLESFAADEQDNEDDDDIQNKEHSIRQKRKNNNSRKERKLKEQAVKGNIEENKLWR